MRRLTLAALTVLGLALLADPGGAAGKRNTRGLETSLQADVTADDSDKTFTVPAGKSWVLQSVYVRLVTMATVGNRQMEVKLTDGSNNELLTIRAGAVQAASLTRFYNFGPDFGDLTAFRDTDSLTSPFPVGLTLPTGFKVRVFDKAAIAAAADDMDVRILVEELVE